MVAMSRLWLISISALLVSCSAVSSVGGDDPSSRDPDLGADAAADGARGGADGAGGDGGGIGDGGSGASDAGGGIDDGGAGSDTPTGDAVSDGGGSPDAASPDAASPDAGPPFGGPPDIVDVFPQIAVSDGLIYLEGERLARGLNDTTGVTVDVLTDDAELGEVVIPLGVVTGVPSRLVARTPLDFHTRLRGRGRVRITTPDGSDTWQYIYATEDSAFSAKTEPGMGLRGNVYRLVEGTPALPNLDDACSDPQVINSEEFPCPFTSVLVSEVNVPLRSWEVGFPGLLADVLEWFAIRFSGYLMVDASGEHTFEICSDDGSNLWIFVDGDWRKVVDNDGVHSLRCRSAGYHLEPGRYPVKLDYYQGPRTEIAIVLKWRPPGAADPVVVSDRNLRLFDFDIER